MRTQKEELSMGRRITSLVGMAIYGLEKGKRIGSVKDVIYDTQNRRLLAFTLERHGVFSPTRYILPFDNVKSIGRDAIMVESERAFIPERQLPDVSRMLNRKPKGIKSKSVVTESGNYLGAIADVMVDDSSGQTVSYETTKGVTGDIGSGRNYVPADQAIIVGEDAVIVPDVTEQRLAEQEPGGLAAAYQSAVAGGRGMVESADAYTQEQEIRLSKDKTSGQDVYDDQGNLIVAKGDVISDYVIDNAVEKGKMHQVAVAAGVGGAAAGYESMKGGTLGATRDQLRGRVVPSDITNRDGDIVILKGTIITDETLDIAEEAGVMGALSRSVLRGEIQTRGGTLWGETKERATGFWSGITERSKESASRADRRRAVAEQKQFLKGKVSATDVRDDTGLIILREGELITPLVIDTLDREGKLEMVRLMPEGQPAEGPEEEEEEPTIHIVVERPDEHQHHH